MSRLFSFSGKTPGLPAGSRADVSAMPFEPGDRHLVQHSADAIRQAFETYQREFKRITRRARSRFENCDWHGIQQDAVERLDVYARVIAEVVAGVRRILDDRAQDGLVWAQMKAAYSQAIARRVDFELAETFFNSVTRRIFATVGVDPRIEFVAPDFDAPQPAVDAPAYATYTPRSALPELIRDILAAHPFSTGYQDVERDARRVAEAIERERQRIGQASPVDAIDVLRPVFYRNTGAYLIGRVRNGSHSMPLALALRNTGRGIFVDAALLTADEVSIVFSFTRSYFHVDADRPHQVIAFLKSIMPRKPIAELYIAIGYHKHGKTALYRDLLWHIQHSTDKFEIARGDRGMVMLVFTLPSYDVVFKIIRDQFAYPKTTTRRDVMQKYQLVFKHDRAGRLVDAQEFEHLAFAKDRFSDELLAELTSGAAESVTIHDDVVDIRHLYTERRITPLNLYLRDADAAAAREAVIDYGQAVKDLAATNIFPGDMLLKNFGVTRHGRVIFYDYDELCLLTDCNFRDLPQARDFDEEFGAEPWFYVGVNDIFPEEFITFLGFQAELRAAFLRAHQDLLTASYWRGMQARHRAGEVIDIFPYRHSRRLRPDGS